VTIANRALKGSSLARVAIFEHPPELLGAVDSTATAELAPIRVPQLCLDRGP